MATTNHLGVTLVEQAQAQKEVTVNEALARIDAMLNTGAIDKDLTTPPGSPSEGDVYLVAASATGDWSGHDGDIAYFDQNWRFITPRAGVNLWLNDEGRRYTYDGSAWSASEGPDLKAYSYATATNASSGTSADIDLSSGNIHNLTLTDNCTLTFSNPPASGNLGEFLLILAQDGTGGRSLTWPSGILWAGGSAPTLTTTASAVDILRFMTHDGGTNWYGFLLGADMQ